MNFVNIYTFFNLLSLLLLLFLVVRATVHQGDETFNENTRGTQCTTKSFVFLLRNSMCTIEMASELDRVLSQGDHLHGVLNSSLGRLKAEKLSFDELQESVKKLCKKDDNLQFGTIFSGDILANSAEPPFFTLEQALEESKESSGALLRIGDYTSGVKLNAAGSIRLFDPHARDENGFVNGDGTSVVIDFQNKTSFHSYLKQFTMSNGTVHTDTCSTDTSSICYTLSCFELMPLFVQRNDCLQNLLKTIKNGSSEKASVSSKPDNK